MDCKACHVESFKGTPQTCVACHAEPPAPKVHKYRYGTNCVQCHATTTWKGADFKHTFPINHGSRRGKGATGNTCATCHANSLNFKVYTCYNCHQHQQAKIERIHLQRRIKDFQDCARCHKTGRGGDRHGALDTGELNRWLAAATDLNAVSSEVVLLNYFRSTVQAENPLATKCNRTPEGMLRGNCPAAAP